MSVRTSELERFVLAKSISPSAVGGHRADCLPQRTERGKGGRKRFRRLRCRAFGSVLWRRTSGRTRELERFVLAKNISPSAVGGHRADCLPQRTERGKGGRKRFRRLRCRAFGSLLWMRKAEERRSWSVMSRMTNAEKGRMKKRHHFLKAFSSQRKPLAASVSRCLTKETLDSPPPSL